MREIVSVRPDFDDYRRLTLHCSSATGLREILQPLTSCDDRVFDEAGNVIETQEHTGDFHEP